MSNPLFFKVGAFLAVRFLEGVQLNSQFGINTIQAVQQMLEPKKPKKIKKKKSSHRNSQKKSPQKTKNKSIVNSVDLQVLNCDIHNTTSTLTEELEGQEESLPSSLVGRDEALEKLAELSTEEEGDSEIDLACLDEILIETTEVTLAFENAPYVDALEDNDDESFDLPMLSYASNQSKLDSIFQGLNEVSVAIDSVGIGSLISSYFSSSKTLVLVDKMPWQQHEVKIYSFIYVYRGLPILRIISGNNAVDIELNLYQGIAFFRNQIKSALEYLREAIYSGKL